VSERVLGAGSSPDHGLSKIITSRMLILQSKRLLLVSLRRRLAATGVGALKKRVDGLQAEAALAQHQYRDAVLNWASPEDADYWVVAYTRLIEMGNVLSGKLRDAAVVLPVQERGEITADIEMLEEIVERWTESKRESMAVTVA